MSEFIGTLVILGALLLLTSITIWQRSRIVAQKEEHEREIESRERSAVFAVKAAMYMAGARLEAGGVVSSYVAIGNDGRLLTKRLVTIDKLPKNVRKQQQGLLARGKKPDIDYVDQGGDFVFPLWEDASLEDVADVLGQAAEAKYQASLQPPDPSMP
jgi:hypothetical protein